MITFNHQTLSFFLKIKFIFLFFLLIAVGAGIILFSRYTADKTQEIRSKAATDSYSAVVTIDGSGGGVPLKYISPDIWGIGFMMRQNPPATNVTSYMNNFNPAKLKELGIANIRYPGGCDPEVHNPIAFTKDGRLVMELKYNFNGSPITQYIIPMNEAISFAGSISPETKIFYGANIESKQLTDPCSWKTLYPGKPSEEENRTQLVADLKTVINSYKNSLRYVEFGNEQWNAWQPADYISNVKYFAEAINSIDSTIKKIIVGYPTSGDNMNPDTISTGDSQWTDAIKQNKETMCGSARCFDYVTDHPYFFHGYSNPDDWKISPGKTIPDGSGTTLPSYQVRRISFINGTGNKMFSRYCPVNYAKGKSGGYECNNFEEFDISNSRGVGNESYSGMTIFVYFQNGVQYRRRILIDKGGQKQYHQSCRNDPESWSGLTADCTQWYEVDLTTLVPGGPTSFTDADYLLFFDETNNKQKIRQRYVNGSSTIYERTCDFVNGSMVPSSCPTWIESISPTGDVRGIQSSRYYGIHYEVGTTVKQFVQERYLGTDGKTLSWRDCYINADKVDCSDTTNITVMKSTILPNTLPGIVGETTSYSAPVDFVFFLNNNNKDKFPNNFPGIAAYYAAKEAGDMFDKRITDYSPLGLAITEWNMKCWGWHYAQKNIALGTVEHGFYVGEMLLQMAKNGVFASQFHDLQEQSSSSTACSLFKTQNSTSAEFNVAGNAFALTSVVKNGSMLQISQIGAPVLSLLANSNCSGAGCLKGGYEISKLSTYAANSTDKSKTYIFLINRDSQNASIKINLTNMTGFPAYNKYTWKTLSGNGSFSNTDFVISDFGGQSYDFINNTTTFDVSPITIARIELFRYDVLPTNTSMSLPSIPLPPQSIAPTPSVTVTPTCGPTPSAPNGLTPLIGTFPMGTISLSWNPMAGATKYGLRVNDVTGSPGSIDCVNIGAGDFCSDVATTTWSYNLQSGHQINWFVYAKDACGRYGPVSAIGVVSGAIPPPTPIPTKENLIPSPHVIPTINW